MINYTTMKFGNYTPQFSPSRANKLIEDCLSTVEQTTPDLKSLLFTLAELAKLIKTANYDHQVLNNLISENQILSQERDRLKLVQISQLVFNMELKLKKAEEDSRNLQVEIDEAKLDVPEFLSFQTIRVSPTLRKLAS